ncbi:MAG: lipopolysaccharide kinase InaA family protein [Thermoguttaceae bacterium]
MATAIAIRSNALIAPTSADHASSVGVPSTTAFMWIDERHREALENAGLAEFGEVMNTSTGRCLRVLPDRENWYLKSTLGMYLKKHRTLTWVTRISAALGVTSPPSPGRVEAENALALQSLGIDVMPLMAYGEKLHADGQLVSFLLSEELEGYCELQDFIRRRFPSRERPLPQASPKGRGGSALRRLIVQVAKIARRFHAAGFNHRDFYCCHFLVKETSPGRFDVRLIDLQRVQQRRWFRRRWIVKDLAQLASMSPDDQVGCRGKILFLRTYLGVQKLRPQDKRLVHDVLWKLSLIRRRERRKP